MGIIGIAKKFLNSQIGTGYAVPLDNFVGGKVVCKGFVGTRFVIKPEQESLNGFFEYVVEIKNESVIDNAEENIRKELIYLPAGGYEATISVPVIGEVKSNFTVLNLTTIVLIKYSAKKTIKLFTEPGSHTFRYNDYVDSPESDEVFVNVSAVSGASGGNAGEFGERGSSGNGGNGGNGGSNGNYGETLKSKIIKIDPNESYSLIVGNGGDGGSLSGAKGKPGEATVFDNIFTLPGGSGNHERGEAGETAVGTRGGNGGKGGGILGGDGGLGGNVVGNNTNNGTDGKKGTDGSTSVENVYSSPGYGGGGGGGGSEQGSGGIGGHGGKGGDGFIEIFRGIVVS